MIDTLEEYLKALATLHELRERLALEKSQGEVSQELLEQIWELETEVIEYAESE